MKGTGMEQIAQWAVPAMVVIATAIFGLIGFSVRTFLARMEQYHKDAMCRIDALTAAVEAVRSTMVEHIRDHAAGMFLERPR